jgi:Ca2+-binding RTX toxin-like protein
MGGAAVETGSVLSGNATPSGGAGADTLTGGTGAYTFVFAKGEAAGDRVGDLAAEDGIEFLGYGAGSTLTQVAGSAIHWTIRNGVDGTTEVISFTNGFSVDPSDYYFA